MQLGGSRLGRVPCQSKIATKNAGTSSWPSWISHFTGSFVGHSPSEMLCPPALGLKRKRTEGRKREKFYIYSDVTHTHTIFHAPPFTQHFVTHHLFFFIFWHTIFHTTLSHTFFHHTILHTPSLTHQLWHTIFDTTSFAPFFTHRHRPIFRTPTLSHTIFHHTILHTPLCHTPSFTTPPFTRTTLSHIIFHHTIFHTPLHFVTHSISFRHSIFHTPLCHTLYSFHPTIFHTPLHIVTRSLSHNFVTHTISSLSTISHTTLSHTQLCFSSRSFTTSFVFPFFPVPATTFGAHYWKTLPCGVFWPFNSVPPQCSSMA